MRLQSQSTIINAPLDAIKLQNFGDLQARYQGMTLTHRARSVLTDADTALKTADRILHNLANHPKIDEVFERIRGNGAVIAKIRPSEAKNILLDRNTDFIDMARHKLAVWRKTMERIADGEGVMFDAARKEYISGHVPLAMAITSASTVSTYLSTLQLAFNELMKIDAEHALQHGIDATKIRRCATYLSDCEIAASFKEAVH